MMNTNKKIVLIKSVHTLIWVFYNAVIFYMFYAAVINQIGRWFWVCSGFVILEGLILLIFNLTCPLTLLARRYCDSTKYNFDIYLPLWLAKYTKIIYSSLIVVIIFITVFQFIK